MPVGWDLAARLIHDNLKAVDGPKSLGDLTQLAPFCGETGFEKDTTAVCTTDDDLRPQPVPDRRRSV